LGKVKYEGVRKLWSISLFGTIFVILGLARCPTQAMVWDLSDWFAIAQLLRISGKPLLSRDFQEALNSKQRFLVL